MRDGTWSETTDRPFDGETRKLELPPTSGGVCRGGRFPWQALWLIWPLMFLVKGAAHLGAPLLAWLGQPLVLTITPLPLLLIGAGLLLLIVGAARRRDR